MRDLLEQEIIKNALLGDTTVLAELLTNLSDDIIINSLSDENQAKIKHYYEIHVVGKNGFSTTVSSIHHLEDDDVIMLAYEEDKLEGDDCHYVDYVKELSYEEWDIHFNFNKK